MKFRKTFSGLLAGTMLLPCNIVLPAHAEDTSSLPQPLVQVTFDDGSADYELKDGATLVEGRSGKALSLDGNGQYATVDSVADSLTGITGDFTISVWANPSSIGSWARIFDFGNGSTGDYTFLTASTGSVARFVMKNGTEQMVDSNGLLSTDEWQNVVISRSGSTTTFYIDGKAVGSTESMNYEWSTIGKFQNYYLGKSQFAADAYYAGMIDDFKIYNCAATTELLKELAADKYVDETTENINNYNCQLLETKYYLNDSRVFALGKNQTGTLKAVTTIKNYTAASVDMTISMYADNSAGSSAAEIESSTVTLQSGEIKDITYTVDNIDLTKYSDIYTVALNGDGENYKSSILEITDSDFVNPVVSPADDASTTYGAHDPSIVKYDGDDTYYVYSSHHLIFTSTDLVNWKKYDFTSKTVQDISPKTYNFITKNYTNATCNGTYWAPDVIYVEGDEHPYWMYISVSCSLNARNSVISLMKSDSPLFWADDNADIVDAGVVFATKENNSYVTNAIDANIYYDSASSKPYFIWGSFWGGIQAAELADYKNNELAYKDNTVTVDGDLSSGAAVVVAEYNDNDLTSAKTYPIDSSNTSVTVNDVTTKDGDRIYLWNSVSGMKPLCNYYLEIKNGKAVKKSYTGGFVSSVDYSSDAKILSTSATTKKTIYSQKSGIAGPEGAWMLEHDGYRYAFTSYGWLGSNYNTRVARSSLDKSFADSTLTDANGKDMSTEYSKGSTSTPSGYKLIGSFRLGDGSTTIEGNDDDYYISRKAGDAHIYYGPGHNSAINTADGESFYVSHTRKDAVEGAAYLQVRKMLWTSDGWPVVNPIVYAGEKEQVLPEDMIPGTYDLASVGHTKKEPSTETSTLKARNFDLPVISSKVTLNEDKTITNASGTQIGTWEFDKNYTVTLKFTASGDSSKDEFYKSGDVMTMYALLSYDKDEEDFVMALTGADENHITQFARKSMSNVVQTKTKTISSTPISIAKSTGGNPELGFDDKGNTLYGGDPAATVIDTNNDGVGDTVYLIVGHDTATTEAYNMPNWVLYTSTNMTDWTYKGEIMSASSISWASNKTSAWASQMIEHNGKYYLYFCTWDKTSNGEQSIGVAVADKPEGPYTDIGSPLIKGTFTTPSSSTYNDIDPTVWVETVDGVEHRYLAWGNGKYYVCELNDDMISVKDRDGDGSIVMHKDVVERKIKSLGSGDWFTEAPWIYRRQDSEGNYYGKYYLFFAKNWREEMAYATADDLFGRYDYKQTIMPANATANTNHPSVIDFNGKTYFIYHNGALPHGSGFRRSVCIQELEFDENGYVYPLTELSVGLDGKSNTIVSSSGKYVAHDQFTNSSSDNSYPIKVSLKAKAQEDGYNTAWEIKPAKAAPSGENAENYVSIQSVNKPGLYLSYKDGELTLTQDADGNQSTYMTFKTVKGLDGNDNTVSFEPISSPGRYLLVSNNNTSIGYPTDLAEASFTLGTVSDVPRNEIDPAPVEPDPDPIDPISNDFNSTSTGTIMKIETTDQGANTTFDGVSLYIGTRSGGADSSTSWSVVSGGITGNALMMTSGKFANINRAPRIQLTNAEIPDGITLSGSIYAKLGTSLSKLYCNDSTSTLSSSTDTDITSKLSTSEWKEIKVEITNDSDTYTRVIYVDGEQISQDYVDTFPVLWGTDVQSTAATVYFDDVSIKMTDANGETVTPPQAVLPDAYVEYSFDDDLSGLTSVNSNAGTDNAPDTIVTTAGKSGAEGDKALSFSGEGSGGVLLDKAPTKTSYTISFDVKLNSATKYTPFVLLLDYNSDGTARTTDTDACWVSIAPLAWQETIDNGPMIWSRDIQNGQSWNDIYKTGNKALSLNKWQNITVTSNGTTGSIYVDGSLVADGTITNIIDSTTKIFIGVNMWDTPLDGEIDNLKLYNEALTAAQVKLLVNK